MPDNNDNQKKEANYLDTLIVCNIDLNCNITDSEENYPHQEYFQVRWSGHPHRIAPGKIKKMPRFLAEHYAKHLADHILTKMEEQTGKKGLVNSMIERPRVLKEILLGIDTYFMGENELEVGEKVVQMVDTLNEERPIDLGSVPNPMIGILKPEPKRVETETVGEEPSAVEDNPPPTAPTEKTSIWDDSKPKPTRKELMADCDRLGIEITGKETVDQLISKIKSF